MKYTKYFNPRNQTPQSRPAHKDQVKNSAGGYTFKLDPLARLQRFLILGSESPTYYAGARSLTKENAASVVHCWETEPRKTAQAIWDVSTKGRAPKNDPAIFAVALGASSKNAEARVCALDLLPAVCRTGTHIFQFAEVVKHFRGWGRGLRKAVASWYLTKPTDKLAYQLVKYQNRNGWSHSDLLRLSHPKTTKRAYNDLFSWVLGCEVDFETVPHVIEGYEKAKQATTATEVAKLIREYRLTHEMIPTQFKREAKVWEALLEKMPMTAMIRNLGNMSKVGLLVEGNWDVVAHVTKTLTNTEFLQKARIHPLNVLSAHNVYSSGSGYLGSGSWSPVSDVVAALEEAFYMSFKGVEPTGKRLYLGIDVSSSMRYGHIAGISGITPHIAAATMAMVAKRIEPFSIMRGFTRGSGGSYTPVMQDLGINATDNLNSTLHKVQKSNFGGTDCALPMMHALERGYEIDTFIIYTDNETWAGKIHPHEALNKYRSQMGIDAKLIVVGFTATDFSIADPNDPGMLDIVGFDSAAPELMNKFMRAEF